MAWWGLWPRGFGKNFPQSSWGTLDSGLFKEKSLELLHLAARVEMGVSHHICLRLRKKGRVRTYGAGLPRAEIAITLQNTIRTNRF